MRKYAVSLLISGLLLVIAFTAAADDGSSQSGDNKPMIAITAGWDSNSFDIYKISLIGEKFGMEFGYGGALLKGFADSAKDDTPACHTSGIDCKVSASVYELGAIYRFQYPYLGIGYSHYSAKAEVSLSNSGVTGSSENTGSSLGFFGGFMGRADNGLFGDVRIGYRYALNGEMTSESNIAGAGSVSLKDKSLNLLDGAYVGVNVGFAFK